ncbi:hypothetical protein CONLIGDRAFT_576584, partial [Coniochaeta ligniaria NRRL 30616]
QYTFDKDSQVNCLARWPHILQIQTIPLDERHSIGVVDLRTCLQAVAQCSPEIVNHQEFDYTVYASDYSEPDIPLVGQGMLSWGLDPNSDPQSQQLVTGRVTRNLMALFGKGNSDTLEVRLKLTAVRKVQPRGNMESQHRHTQSFHSQPDATNSEWNSFIQSNPGLGHSVDVSRFSSPSILQGRMDPSAPDMRYAEPRPENLSFQQNRPPSTAPTPIPAPAEDSLPQLPQLPQQPTQPIQPAQLPPPPTSDIIGPEKPARPSRPSSRASRSRAPTGRPRGRPRKKPLDAGHTSGAEMTDADDGPQRKRAKVVTQVDYNTTAPFSSHPDSLRVAASTSGSLRNMRPVGAAGGVPAGNHFQDIPRAPTPVPNASQQQKRPSVAIPRKGSMAGFETYQMQSSQPSLQMGMSMGMSQDARSPTDSIAQSPDQGYTPGESPADLGSSPPVPRTSAYPQSSPAPSSPTLPPVDSGFMSGGIEDFFDEDDLAQDLPRQEGLPDMLPKLPLQKPAPRRSNPREIFPRSGLSHPQAFSFQEVNPGPQEMLPQASLFNPHGRVKALNRPQVAPLQATPSEHQGLNRAHVAPLEATPSEPKEPTRAHDAPLEATPSEPKGPNRAQPEPINQSQTTASAGLQGWNTEVLVAEPPLVDPPTTERLVAELPTAEPQGTGVEQLKAEPSPLQAPFIASAATEPTLARPSARVSQVLSAPVLLPPIRRASPRTTSLPPPPVPASDPVMQTFLTLPQLPDIPQSEGPCPLGEDGEQPKYNKNLVKKQSIKDRLETAIAKGEMPPFCNNCGAIETPTWRKIWTQEHQGVPGFHEFSDKPGCVTCIDILERNPEGKPTLYRLVKKNLGGDDLRIDWKELLLCNPCGIWLAKFKGHRPPDRWDKDASRLNQPRKKRGQNGEKSRSKRQRTKSDGQMNPTSDAYPMTDPYGPEDGDSPKDEQNGEDGSRSRRQSTQYTEREQSQPTQPTMLSLPGPSENRAPGSTHSRGSGTANSPIPIDDTADAPGNLGGTRRLLFPSPRKDGVPKVLGELAVNIVQTAPDFQHPKPATSDKENVNLAANRAATPSPPDDDDLDQELFGTPPPRPSTPPPKSAQNGPFKTPTRPTPSHRPITRSISRSIRSVKSGAKSPSQALLQLQRTPSKTPRSVSGGAINFSLGLSFSASKRRTPRPNPAHAHFALDSHVQFDSPFTATMNQLLSEANEFTNGSPSHGLVDMDLSSLPNLHSDDVMQQLAAANSQLDFGSFLPADMGLSSSPPLLRGGQGHHHTFPGMDESAIAEMWAKLSAATADGPDEKAA